MKTKRNCVNKHWLSSVLVWFHRTSQMGETTGIPTLGVPPRVDRVVSQRRDQCCGDEQQNILLSEVK